MRKFISIITILIIAFLFVGCDENELQPKLQFEGNITAILVGEEKELKVKVENIESSILWESSNPDILSVENGVIKGISEGSATITASLKEDSGISAKVTITVTEETGPVVVITPTLELKLNETEITISGTTKIETIITNSDKLASFKSKNTEVAIVDSEGNITGISVGEAIIEVTIEGTDLKKEFKVTVTEPNLTVEGETEVVAGSSIELKALLNGVETKAEWNSEEPKVATVVNGKVTGISAGDVVISATVNGIVKKVTITVKSNEQKPKSIEVTTEAETIYATDTISLNIKVLPEEASQEISYKSSNEKIAKIDSKGNVIFKKGGEVVITITSSLDKKVKTSITLTALDYIDPIKFFTDYNVGTVNQEFITLYGGGFSSQPITLLSGTVSYYYFEDFVVDTSKAYDDPNTEYSYGTRTSTWFITVHDSAANKDSNGTGYALAVYAAGSAQDESKSWHYSVGSDGIYKGLNENLAGWHAGSGRTEVKWTDTGVAAGDEEWADITISEDGYWVLNGVKSSLAAPEVPNQYYDKNEKKWVTTGYRLAKTSDLPYTGIANKVGSNGNFYINDVWWSSSYQTLSNCGGNMNSIGMESAVNESVNLEVCWHNIAKLCADIIVRRNLALGLKAICQHNTFSGKDCPMTMRTANRWEYFMKMAEAEYYARKYLNDFKFEFSSESNLVNDKGQVIKFPETDTEVEYTVRITSSKYGYDQTVKLKANVPAAITK